MRNCDWSKSRHVMYTKSQLCPHETLVPSWIFIYVNSALIIIQISLIFFKQQSEPLEWQFQVRLSLHTPVRTVHMCVFITVYNCGAQYSTEQFW